MTQNWDEKLKTTMAIAAAGTGFMAAAGNILYDYIINRSQNYMFGPLKKYKESVKVGFIQSMDLAYALVPVIQHKSAYHQLF